MGPTSITVLVGLGLLAVALVSAVAVAGRRTIKIVAAVLTLIVSVFTGMIVVNDFFGYYTSWSAAVADLTGHGNAYAVGTVRARTGQGPGGSGRLVTADFRGPSSGIDRKGLVYLPPQYFEPGYRKVRFPVLELFHGTPGDPAVWVSELRVTSIMMSLIDRHEVGPMVLVMPDSNGGLQGRLECLDSHATKDDTYLTTDVPHDVQTRFRVSSPGAEWGMLGFSSGGYCAANLGLRHRQRYGAIAAIDGYFRPQDGPAAAALGRSNAVLEANNPLDAALSTTPGRGPLPACWVAAGTGKHLDYVAAEHFVQAMRRLETVPFLVERGAMHTAKADRDALPAAFIWAWQQVATPELRVQFPTGGNRGG